MSKVTFVVKDAVDTITCGMRFEAEGSDAAVLTAMDKFRGIVKSGEAASVQVILRLRQK